MISYVAVRLTLRPQLVLPTMRSAVKEQFNLIAKGKANYELVRHALEIFRLQFVYFVQHIENMDHLFEDTFQLFQPVGEIFQGAELVTGNCFLNPTSFKYHFPSAVK